MLVEVFHVLVWIVSILFALNFCVLAICYLVIYNRVSHHFKAVKHD